MLPQAPKPLAAIPKSPAKHDKNHDNNINGSVTGAKSRVSLSPSFTKQPANHNMKTKILGSSLSPELERLAGTSNDSSVAKVAHKQDIKREPYCDMCHKVEQQRRGFKFIDCLSCAFRGTSHRFVLFYRELNVLKFLFQPIQNVYEHIQSFQSFQFSSISAVFNASNALCVVNCYVGYASFVLFYNHSNLIF